MSEQSWESELEQISQEITEQPEDWKNYLRRGLLLEEQEQYEEAYEDYTRAMEIPEGKPRALLFRARLYILYDDYEAALDDLNNSIKLDSEAPEGYQFRAQVYALQGKEDEARDEMELYYARIPRELFFQEAYSDLLEELEEGTVSLESYEAILTSGDTTEKADAHFRRGLIYIQQNAYDKAASEFDHAQELQPDLLSAQVERAYLKRRTGQYEEALTDLQAVAEKKKNLGRMLFHLRVTQDLIRVREQRLPYVDIWEDIDPDITYEIIRAFKKANVSYRFAKGSESMTAAQNFTRMLQVLDEHIEKAIDILEGRTEYLEW